MLDGEILKGAIVEFAAVVALDRLERKRELCSDISTKVRQKSKSFRFLPHGICPYIVSEII